MNNEYIHVRAAEEAIKNGQSRETGNIGYTIYKKKKTNKENSTQQNMCWTPSYTRYIMTLI